MSLSPSTPITVGARGSRLSKVQFEEIKGLLLAHYPNLYLEPEWIETEGDRDKKTSLRIFETRNDFFTRDIDRAQLKGQIRLSIHSAKDLPETLALGLKVVAVTEGLDPSDSLVLPDGKTLETLPKGAMVATSSSRREEVCRKLRPDFNFCDIRGTIEERLALLEIGKVDAIVIAECALQRLGLTKLNRITLPGDVAEGQGQLAVVAREDDHEMAELCRCIDSRTHQA